MLDIARSLLLCFFAVAVLLPVIRYVLRSMSPARRDIAIPEDELKYLQKQEWKLTFAYFFFTCVLAVFSAGALSIFSSIVNMSSQSMHVLTPNFRALFAPGLLLGLTLALIPLRLIQSTLLGQDYELYKSYLQQVEGRDSARFYRALLLVLLALSGVVVWFTLSWHVYITDKQVQITNLLRQERVYDMQEISQIEYLGAEGEYLISFDDNTLLNTAYLKPVQFEMVALLSARSGKRVIR